MRHLGKARFSLYVSSMVVILFGQVCSQDLNEPSTTPSHFATTTQQAPIEQDPNTATPPTFRGTQIETAPQQQESPLSSRHPRAKSSEQIHAHKHDPSQTETFLGQVTLNSPAELPPEFASRDIPGFREAPEYLLRNSVGGIYRKDTSPIKIISTTQRTNILEMEEEAITKMRGKDNFTPAYLNVKPSKYTIMPRSKLLDLEPLLEEPMNKKDYSEHNKQDVQVINSLTKIPTDLPVDSGPTKDHRIIAITKKETDDLESADDSYTTPFTMENAQTTTKVHEENTTQGDTTSKHMQSTTAPASTTKATRGTATTESRNIEETSPTLRFAEGNSENREQPVSDATATKSSLIDYRKSASTRANEDIAVLGPRSAVNSKTLSRYNQSSRSISEITDGESLPETESAVHSTIASLIGSDVTETESSASTTTIEPTTLSSFLTTAKTKLTTVIINANNGGSEEAHNDATVKTEKSNLLKAVQHANEYETKPSLPTGETISRNGNVTFMNNSDDNYSVRKQKTITSKISLSLKDIFNDAIKLDQGKVDAENFTQANLFQKDQYSLPIPQALYKTNNNYTNLSTRLQDTTSTTTIATLTDRLKHLPAKNNQSNKHDFNEISTDDIPHHHRPLALVKSWSTSTKSDAESLSLASLPTSDYRIGTFPSKSETTPHISKLANFNVCFGECDLAGIIKLTEGVTWIPQLSDKSTEEWRILADEIRTELERIYNKSDLLKKWYKKIRVDGFSEGSVLVDYIVELNDIGRQINTFEIKKMFHESLDEVVKSLGGKKMVKFKTNLGNFTIDPVYTDFIVLPHLSPTIEYAENNLLPQWAIAVIVIGLASLLFVIIFGVTVLTNRRKTSKKKLPLPFAEDIFAEVNKKHMLGIDNYATDSIYNME